ncbi:hypothetical protein CYMTET_54454 [Cymbomonas tetramitiformis]|uniref:Uncharacterized protein n=1 Tax=Cymbomonas tetramitiformis TaxID=36881 RepID=A0AAE0BF55_9CHLO|nr:hypothetical protein CYMTET_54454 [Cymbomonas tetramitiformis]
MGTVAENQGLTNDAEDENLQQLVALQEATAILYHKLKENAGNLEESKLELKSALDRVRTCETYIQELEDELQGERAETEYLRQQIDELPAIGQAETTVEQEAQMEELRKEAERAHSLLDETRDEFDAQRERAQSLADAEISALKIQLETMQMDAGPSTTDLATVKQENIRVAHLEVELGVARTEAASLRKQLKAAEREKAAIASTRWQLLYTNEKLEESATKAAQAEEFLRAELRSARASPSHDAVCAARAEDSIGALQAELQKCRQQNQFLQTALDNSGEEIGALSQNAVAAQQENYELRRQVERVQTLNDASKSQLLLAQSEAETAQQTVMELEERIILQDEDRKNLVDGLQAKLGEKGAEAGNAQKVKIENNLLNQKLAEALREGAMARTAAQKLEGQVAEFKDYSTIESATGLAMITQRSRDKELYKAVCRSNCELVEMLLVAGAQSNFAYYVGGSLKPEISVRRFNFQGREVEFQTPLHLAVMLGHTAIVKALVKAGADPNFQAVIGTSLLSQCVTGCMAQAVRCLIVDAGADVNLRDKNGETALLTLVSIEHGKLHPLSSETAEAKTAILSLLLEHGAETDVVMRQNGYTALMYAAQAGNLEHVMMLIEAKANVNIKGQKGDTALKLASKFKSGNQTDKGRSQMIVKALIEAGAQGALKSHRASSFV